MDGWGFGERLRKRSAHSGTGLETSAATAMTVTSSASAAPTTKCEFPLIESARAARSVVSLAPCGSADSVASLPGGTASLAHGAQTLRPQVKIRGFRIELGEVGLFFLTAPPPIAPIVTSLPTPTRPPLRARPFLRASTARQGLVGASHCVRGAGERPAEPTPVGERERHRRAQGRRRREGHRKLRRPVAVHQRGAGARTASRARRAQCGASVVPQGKAHRRAAPSCHRRAAPSC